MALDISDPLSINAHIGTEIGRSDWITLSQQEIDAFGHLTRDVDAMHMDPDWAKAHSPFGTTIVYGFQTVAMMTSMVNQILPRGTREAFKLNYGFDRLRLVAPIGVGVRFRGVARMKSVADRGENRHLITVELTIAIEAKAKPAAVADWLFMVVNGEADQRRPALAQ